MAQWTKDTITADTAKTLDGLFRERVRRSSQSVAYQSFGKISGAWTGLTWGQITVQVARWQTALTEENLQPGDRVAVLMRNGPEWVIFDQAALGLGLVLVPLYTDDRPDNVAYILDDCAAKLLLVQDLGHWRRIQPALKSLNMLRVLITASGENKTPPEDARVRYVDDWLPAFGDGTPHADNDPQQLASIVYTSGTTGRPKGVMLSHHNMLSNAEGALTLFDAYREDVFLSLLPLSHTLERTTNYYLPMMAGAAVAYTRSIPQLGEDLLALRPTIMICVPRVLERIHAKIVEQMRKRSWLERWLFSRAVNNGWRRFEHAQGRARTPLMPFGRRLERRVSDKLLSRFGGRLRLAVSGGAALSQPVARMFIGLGLPLLQGYGLTETSPVISVNPVHDNDPASVGVPLPGVELRLGESDELLVKSPGVMQGYWNNHSATHQVIDAAGWLHTGDQARLANGHVYITGRIKDILVLSNGEKIPTGDMEMAIKLDPLFDQALVIGEGQAFLGALLVLNEEHWATLAKRLDLHPDDATSLEDSRAQGAVRERVTKQLRDFPGYAKIRRVILLREPWSVENELLTPTMKVKRNKVLEQYGDIVQRLFDEGPAAPRRAKA